MGSLDTVVVSYAQLRRDLDEAGYRDILPLEGLPLVQHLWGEVVGRGKSLKVVRKELEYFRGIATDLSTGVAPYKTENVRLIRENSHLRMGAVRVKEECQEEVAVAFRRLDELEEEKFDLKQIIQKLSARLEVAKFKEGKIFQFQEKDLESLDTLEKSKQSRSRMDDCCYSEMREPYPCSYCVCLRNSSKEQDSGREQKAVDYFKIADARIEALQLQIRALKSTEKENLSQVSSMKGKVESRDREIEKLRNYVTVRPGKDNAANGLDLGELGLDSETNKDLGMQLKSAQMQLDLLQKRNINLERRLKANLLQEHDDFMSGRVRSGAEKDLFKRLSALEDSDRYPTHPEMTLNDKLVQLELQFKECCKEKAELKSALEKCEASKKGDGGGGVITILDPVRSSFPRRSKEDLPSTGQSQGEDSESGVDGRGQDQGQGRNSGQNQGHDQPPANKAKKPSDTVKGSSDQVPRTSGGKVQKRPSPPVPRSLKLKSVVVPPKKPSVVVKTNFKPNSRSSNVEGVGGGQPSDKRTSGKGTSVEKKSTDRTSKELKMNPPHRLSSMPRINASEVGIAGTLPLPSVPEDTTSQTKKKSDPSKKSSNPPQTTRPSTQPQEPSRRSKEPQKIPEDNGSTSDTPTIPEVDEPSTEDEPRDSIVKEQRSYASMAIPPSQRPSASGSITGPKDPDTADPPGPVESTHSIKPLVLFVKTPKKKGVEKKKGEEKVPSAGSPSDGNGTSQDSSEPADRPPQPKDHKKPSSRPDDEHEIRYFQTDFDPFQKNTLDDLDFLQDSKERHKKSDSTTRDRFKKSKRVREEVDDISEYTGQRRDGKSPDRGRDCEEKSRGRKSRTPERREREERGIGKGIVPGSIEEENDSNGQEEEMVVEYPSGKSGGSNSVREKTRGRDRNERVLNKSRDEDTSRNCRGTRKPGQIQESTPRDQSQPRPDKKQSPSPSTPSSELKRLNQQIQTLEKRVEILTKEKEEADQQVARLVRQVSLERSRADRSQPQPHHLLQSQTLREQSLEREVTRLKTNLTSLDRNDFLKELEIKDERLSRLTQELSQLRNEVVRGQQRDSQYKTSSQQGLTRDQDREVSYLKRQNESLRSDLDTIRKERDEAVFDNRKLVGSLGKDADDLYKKTSQPSTQHTSEFETHRRLRAQASLQSDLTNEISHLRSSLAKLDRDKDEMRVELDHKDEKLARLTLTIESQEEQLSRLQLALKNSEYQLGHSGESAREQEREVGLLKRQIESLRRDLEGTIGERDEAVKDGRRLAGLVLKEEGQRKSLGVEYEKKSRECDELRRQVQKYIQEVRRIEELLAGKEEELENILEHYRTLSLEKTGLESARSHLEREASSIREDVRETVESSITLKNTLTSQNSLLTAYEQEIERLTQALVGVESQLAILGEKEKTLEEDAKAARGLLYGLEVKMDKLRLELGNCDGERVKLTSENTELRTHIQLLEDQLQIQSEKEKNLEDFIASLREKEFDMDKKREDLDKDKGRVVGELKAVQLRVESLTDDVNKYRLRSIELQNELDKVRRQLVSEKGERDRAIAELSRVQDGLSNSRTNSLINSALLGGGSSGGSDYGGGGRGAGGLMGNTSGSSGLLSPGEIYVGQQQVSPLGASTARSRVEEGEEAE